MISPTTEARYALYFVPDAATDLYRFGASVLGYDCHTGGEVALPSGAGADWPDKVAEPRRYGFHATLKAPFRLAAGTSPAELQVALDAFVRLRPAVEVGPLQVAEIGSFVALVPTEACRPLDDLAAGCVREFDRFRAPLNDKEIARRLKTSMSARQRSNFDRWGYPYVFDDFRFHMTLSGPLADAERAEALRWLQAEFAARPVAQRLTLDCVVIARQTGEAAFAVAHGAALAPAREVVK